MNWEIKNALLCHYIVMHFLDEVRSLFVLLYPNLSFYKAVRERANNFSISEVAILLPK